MPIDLPAVEVIVSALVGIVTILGVVFGWFGKAWRWATARLKRNPPAGQVEIPSKSLILNPTTGHTASWWKLGKADGAPAMAIHATVRATNISNREIVPTVVKINRQGVNGWGLSLLSGNITEIGPNGRIHVDGVCNLSIYFRIQPPFCEAGKSFKANVAVLDQFGNEHWLKGLEFEFNG